MYQIEQDHHPIIEIRQPLENSGLRAHGAAGPVRIGVLLGFLIVLVIEGWLLTKLLLF